jgi:hypothetical protein
MVNNVIRVVNYVIAARPSLLNFMIADSWCFLRAYAALEYSLIKPQTDEAKEHERRGWKLRSDALHDFWHPTRLRKMVPAWKKSQASRRQLECAGNARQKVPAFRGAGARRRDSRHVQAWRETRLFDLARPGMPAGTIAESAISVGKDRARSAPPGAGWQTGRRERFHRGLFFRGGQ